MNHPMRLAYLVFGARKPEEWATFLDRMLGLPAPVANTDGSRGWRIDGARQRLVVAQDPSDDLLALGLELADDAALDTLLARLQSSGLQATPGTAAECEARRVARLVRLHDPAGTAVELVTGVEAAETPFASPAFPGGFVTGDLGLGHAVLVHDDLEAMAAFYSRLGFGVTERLNTAVGPIKVAGIFMHCNARHHSLALFDLPSRTRMHHFMLQAAAHMDVGCAFERAQATGVPLSLALGQHPDPDGTFSFYGSTPSGFDFEIGAGSNTIDPRDWETMRTSVTSSWGHRPQWSLKWRMARALVSRPWRKRRVRAG